MTYPNIFSSQTLNDHHISTKFPIDISDFGFGEGYLDENGNAKPRELAHSHRGTAVYMAPGPLMFYTQVRKDDLISLGIAMLDVHGVSMPWMYLPEAEDIIEDMEQVLESWRDTDIEVV